MQKNDNLALVFLGAILVIAVGGLLTETFGNNITGQAVQTAPSQVIIQQYVAIALSDNLSFGIDFGTIASLPTNETNATYNYNVSSQTEYYVSVSADSNANVDFCVQATEFNNTGGDIIGLGNYTWEDNTTNTLDWPSPFGVAMDQLLYINGTTGVAPGNDNYYRFWLRVDEGQNPGTYNNTVFFQGVATGNKCA